MDTCGTERGLVNLLDQLQQYLNEQFMDLLAKEAGLLHDMNTLCESGSEACQDARRELNNLRTWEMAPLGLAIDSVRDLRNKLEQELRECEHRAKTHLLS